MPLDRNASKPGCRTLLLTTCLAIPEVALAQTASAPKVEEVTVTAQKRPENQQRVPISITAISQRRLDQLQVHGLEDYLKYLPSVSFQQTEPGGTAIFFRGIATDSGGIASGTLPTTGVYLDEQPITTIEGPLDLHIYDIARVEALAGPQGTLYGASSEAGTLRIITNKPDPSHFSAGYDTEVNKIAGGGPGGVVQGYVNVPINRFLTARIVGWYQRTGGYIDNVYGTRTFPTSGITINNASSVQKDFNDVNLHGGRIELGIRLDDTWTMTPSFQGQIEDRHGQFRYDPSVGDLKVVQFYPDSSQDKWYQAALTITGKVADFDVTYAGGYLRRHVDTSSDYSDYSYYYDKLYGSGTYFRDNSGKLINPSQENYDHTTYEKISQELRFASPATERLRLSGGLFYQHQVENTENDYVVADLATSLDVSGHPDTYWLTKEVRIDRDYAAYSQIDYDVTRALTLTAGGRFYDYDNTLVGFFGFGPAGGGYGSSTGQNSCIGKAVVSGTPCTNVGTLNSDGSVSPKRSQGDGFTYRFTATYKFGPSHLVYATVSDGFRPGGINRRGTPYKADTLTNYEVGTKNTFFDRRMSLNLTLFREDWKDVQLTTIGQNGVAQIYNVGLARSYGAELQGSYQLSHALNLSAGGTYTDAELVDPYTYGSSVLAPKGQQLPLTPRLKGNLILRYSFSYRGYDAHAQLAGTYTDFSWTDLRTIQRAIVGKQNAYGNLDLAIGATRRTLSWEFYVQNLLNRRGDTAKETECSITVCGAKVYTVVTQPLTVGLRFGQKF